MSKFNNNQRGDNLIGRLTRLESKLVRGFEELGVSLDVDRNWLTVDNAHNVVYVSTLGRSMLVILQEMKARGASKEGEMYEIVHKGDSIGSIVYNPVF